MGVLGDVTLEEDGEGDAGDKGDYYQFYVGFGVLVGFWVVISALKVLLVVILRSSRLCLCLYL